MLRDFGDASTATVITRVYDAGYYINYYERTKQSYVDWQIRLD